MDDIPSWFFWFIVGELVILAVEFTIFGFIIYGIGTPVML
jgi:hypothetical protein